MLESKWAHNLDFSKRISPLGLWLGSLFVWLVGFYASIAGDFDWFSRSGALSISILLVLFTLDARKDADAWQVFSDQIFQRDANDEVLVQSSAVRAYYDEEYKARKFVRHEGYIAAVSTLIWGFGDLLVQPLYEVI